MLVEEFLTPMGIKESDLAEFIHVPAQRINEIITDRKSVTPRFKQLCSRSPFAANSCADCTVSTGCGTVIGGCAIVSR